MTTNTQQQTQVDTKRSDVGSGLTADPEDGKVTIVVEFNELGFVDGPNTKLTLDGRDQRWTLEQGSSQRLDGAGELLRILELLVKTKDGNILLTSTLLRLDKTGSTVNADDQASCHLGVKGTTVTGLLDTENASEPRDNFVRGRVGRLVEVDHTRLDVALQVTFQGRATVRDRGEVRAADEKLVVVLEEQRPVGSVEFWAGVFGLDHEVALLLGLGDRGTERKRHVGCR